MVAPFVIPQNAQPPLDANGVFNRTWYLFFQALFARVGGATGPGNNDLDASLFEDAGTAEVSALLFSSVQDAKQAPQFSPPVLTDDPQTEIRALSEQVAELTKAVQALQQSTLI